MAFSILNLLLFIIALLLADIVLYLLLLTVCAAFGQKKTPLRVDQPSHKFLILIPAHNEETLLPKTLNNLNQLDYPQELFEIHVVADNCTDSTAELARQSGAIAHERFNTDLRGKGYALQWLLQRLWDDNVPHDALIIVDADTVVSQNFLKVMDSRLLQGDRVIQAYYAVLDPEKSWGISLRYAALAVLHYLRPLGRMVLGGSTGLKGNGMVFRAEIMQNREWSSSLTEDIEFHMELVLDGEQVMFAPDAVVWAEMPETLADSDTQNERWEQGRLQMAKTYIPKLLTNMFSKEEKYSGRRFLLFDAAMEHIIPPFSILAASSLFLLISTGVLYFIQPTLFSTINFGFAIFILTGQIIYLFAGLSLAKAPWGVYKAMLYAPVFIIWKLLLYVRVLVKKTDSSWIRTARNEE